VAKKPQAGRRHEGIAEDLNLRESKRLLSQVKPHIRETFLPESVSAKQDSSSERRESFIIFGKSAAGG
jgi:hypothetical protein